MNNIRLTCFCSALIIILQHIQLHSCQGSRRTPLSILFTSTILPSVRPVQIEENSTLTELEEISVIGMGLQEIPSGNAKTHTLKLSYNHLTDLPANVFIKRSYMDVEKIYLHQNTINVIHSTAFKGLKLLKIVDLSDNNISRIDPFTFNTNVKLTRLVLMNNRIVFHRLQPFLISQSLEHLVLSHNEIQMVYETTFLALPNLKTLILDGNNLEELSSNSFRMLHNLKYFSIANTNIFRLMETMFWTNPQVIDLEGTPLGKSFEPPLTRVSGESVAKLLCLSKVMVPFNL